MATTTATAMVAIRPNAVSGPNWNPSHSGSTIPRTNCAITATYGEWYRGWTLAKALGSRRMRPIAYQVRVVAFAPAFEFAMAEFTMARNTNTHPAPHAARARPSQGLALLN